VHERWFSYAGRTGPRNLGKGKSRWKRKCWLHAAIILISATGSLVIALLILNPHIRPELGRELLMLLYPPSTG